MDPRALGEALLTVSLTPVISVAMSLFVILGVIFVVRKVDRK